MSETSVHGTCDPRFERVREVFARSFERGEVGAAVAVTVEGQSVLDLHGGRADAAGTRPWEHDTLVNVYSTTKGMTAICLHRLVEEGRLDLDAPVARYWPEFGQAGKERLPVRFLLSHQAGLPAVRKILPLDALYDWDLLCSALAEETPWWEPGAKHGYHALTFGHLAGEVLRRIDGRSLGTYFQEELAEPLGLDFHIGLAVEHHRRCAEIIPAPPPPEGTPDIMKQLMEGESMTARAFNNPPNRRDQVNTAEWRSAEIPAANGHGTARSLARVYGALATGGDQDGVHVLSPEAVARATEEQAFGPDAVLMGMPMRFGLGFFLTHAMVPLGPNARAFGHPGAGGSIAFADPDARLGFAYVMNQMQQGMAGDARGFALIQAVYEALGA
jgi:CubicO group peptidase (beta-lactamase class C family)